MSVAASNILALQPASSPPHYRASPSFTFHPYEHQSPNGPLNDDHITPPATSTRRAARVSAPFPTFLYASEPPPLTARNKQRVRPSAAQLAELKALYAVTPHPTREVREALGSRIGMRYQSVTNWFQNQRSTAKKRAPVATQIRKATLPATRSRSRSRSRMLSPSSVCSLPHAMDDNMDDSYASNDDVQPARSTKQQLEDYHDDHQSSTLRARMRTDPVRDIIVAQAAARQQQQLIELPLPLSGAAIVPSSFSDLEMNDSPSADTEFKITLPPAPRTTSAPAPASSSRAPTPLLSSFQLSRAPSPSAASTNASVFDTCGEEMHGVEEDYGEGATADQVPRGKRSRPTPHQLAALRALHSVTSSPSIEERIRVGREIGMELGKVTNWFRNLRQTARKKERRALEAEGMNQSSKRGRNGELSRTRQNKRSRLALDEDDDDAVSASASTSHAHSGTFETSSTVGSVDMDYDSERPDAYFVRHHRGEALGESREAYVEHPSSGEYDNNPRFGRSSSFDGPSAGYILPRRREPQLEGHPEHEHEHDHESRSELGTESDAAHEAVTPEPQGLPHPSTERIPSSPHSMTATSRGSPIPADVDHPHHSKSSHSKHPSVDDAMLLLAFHCART